MPGPPFASLAVREPRIRPSVEVVRVPVLRAVLVGHHASGNPVAEILAAPATVAPIRAGVILAVDNDLDRDDIGRHDLARPGLDGTIRGSGFPTPLDVERGSARRHGTPCVHLVERGRGDRPVDRARSGIDTRECASSGNHSSLSKLRHPFARATRPLAPDTPRGAVRGGGAPCGGPMSELYPNRGRMQVDSARIRHFIIIGPPATAKIYCNSRKISLDKAGQDGMEIFLTFWKDFA